MVRKMLSKFMGKNDPSLADEEPVEECDESKEEYEAAKKEADEALQQLKTVTRTMKKTDPDDTGEFSGPLPVAAG